MDMALGSANELENHILLASDLGLLGSTQRRQLIDGDVEVRKMLLALRRQVREGGPAGDS